ncbi:MAG: hypothetical protein AB1679_09535 [Actinomycetota bacterium]
MASFDTPTADPDGRAGVPGVAGEPPAGPVAEPATGAGPPPAVGEPSGVAGPLVAAAGPDDRPVVRRLPPEPRPGVAAPPTALGATELVAAVGPGSEPVGSSLGVAPTEWSCAAGF